MASTTRLLTSGKREYTKSFLAYDGSGRLEYVYEAPIAAAEGAPCLVTKYSYVTTTTRVEKRREYEGTWSAAYDLA